MKKLLCLFAMVAFHLVYTPQNLSAETPTSRPTTMPSATELLSIVKPYVIEPGGHGTSAPQSFLATFRCYPGGPHGIRFRCAYRAPKDLAVTLFDEADDVPLVRIVGGQALIYDPFNHALIYVPQDVYPTANISSDDDGFNAGAGYAYSVSGAKFTFDLPSVLKLADATSWAVERTAQGRYKLTSESPWKLAALIDTSLRFPCAKLVVEKPKRPVLAIIDQLAADIPLDDAEFAPLPIAALSGKLTIETLEVPRGVAERQAFGISFSLHVARSYLRPGSSRPIDPELAKNLDISDQEIKDAAKYDPKIAPVLKALLRVPGGDAAR